MSSEYYGFSIDPAQLPEHIGVIMDGNGRWATLRRKKRTFGHQAGSRAVRRIVKACRTIGIKYLTLYAFSAQNWNRPVEEVSALMDLLGEFIVKEWKEIMDKDIRVVHIGELRRIPPGVKNKFKDLIEATKKNKSMTLALALNYGSREEIVKAVRKMISKATRKELSASDVDQEVFSANLFSRHLPDPDLIIRTGGEKRISNFLLWQSAYAEFFFVEKLWPDFNEKDLMAALVDFQKRQRRFGLTDEQARQSIMVK
jgi:undecaprenyl diphosphate synthase